MSAAKKDQLQLFDIIVVGGGMVGATFACAIAKVQPEMKIAVLDSADIPDWNESQYDQRVSAVTRASQHFLKNIGVWEKITQRRISPFREMHVWDATGEGEIHFDSACIGEPDMGHIVENSVIQLSAYEQLQQHENVSIFTHSKAQSLQVSDALVSLTLDDGRLLEAKLLVGADGANSWVRQAVNIETRGWDYDQKAVVTTVKTSQSHQETAWQRFLPTGPLAFLPLTEGRSSIVWSATHDRADQLLALSDDEFIAELVASFDARLGKVESVTPRLAFPLKLQHATTYISERVVLIGDAAHTIHPLAGQGVNLGFMDAATLAQVLADAAQKKSARQFDVGSRCSLRRYERWRKADNLSTLAGMDMFKKLFGNNVPALRWLRNTGLSVTQRVDPVKNIIMRHTMGINGDLPGLARPVLRMAL